MYCSQVPRQRCTTKIEELKKAICSWWTQCRRNIESIAYIF